MMMFSELLPRGVVITKAADLSAMILQASSGGGEHLLPVLRADLAGEIRLIMLLAGGRIPARLLEHNLPPAVIIVGGDPGPTYPTPTPESFPQARRLLGWAGSTMLNAAAGKPEHYAALVGAAQLVRRVLLIETAVAQQDAWYDLVLAEAKRRKGSGRHLPTLVISPRMPSAFPLVREAA